VKLLRICVNTILCIIVLSVIIVGGYIIYLTVNYERIPDNQPLQVKEISLGLASDLASSGPPTLTQGETYTMATFNIGFGAYDQDYSFFMDKGIMSDGTETVGTYSRARNKDAEIQNTDVATKEVIEQKPDIALFQEVDVKADRSYDVDQRARIVDAFQKAWTEPVEVAELRQNNLYYTYASNFHTSYLFYPPTKPIGRIEDSGLLTISKYQIESSTRRSLPVDEHFPTKYFDLDRCFQINRLPVYRSDPILTKAGELVLINLHTSAYDEGGLIRKEQMKMLSDVLTKEYAKGNWVICGGDFNHAISDSEQRFMGDMKVPEWVQPFDEAMIPEGFTMLTADNAVSVGTTRDSSIVYIPGVNYETILDGFMVSANVQATTTNLDYEYLASDHNPVRMIFTLL
jgi:endonuclease/exonuclease/phosphatase family metal-dependent hydrolase